MSPIFKKFKQDVFGVSFFALGLFLTLALWTYHPQDPSLNSIGQGIKTLNACGIVGSFLADLLYQFFGVSSWAIVFSLFKMGLESFQGKIFGLKDIRLIWATLLVLTFASLLSVYSPARSLFQEQIFPGGLAGLAISQVLIKALNKAGVQIVLWTAALILTIFYSEKTVNELSKWPQAFFHLLINAFKKIKPKKGFKIPKMQLPVFNSLAPVTATSAGSFEFRMQETEPAKENPRSLPVQTEMQINEDTEDDLDDGAFFKSSKRKVILKVKPPRHVANWEMPKIGLLQDPPLSRVKIDEKEIKRKAELLVDKLKNFAIDGQITDAKPGPLVTLYEFKPNVDVKISKISDYQDDLSMALSSESDRKSVV